MGAGGDLNAMAKTPRDAEARWTGAKRNLAFGVVATLATLALGGLALASGGPWQAWHAWSGEVPDHGALATVYSRVVPALWVAEVLAAGGLALLLAWKASRRIEARILTIFLLGLLVPGTGGALRGLGLPDWVELVLVFGVVWLGAGAFVRLTAVFPYRLTAYDVQTESSARTRRAVAALDRWMLRPTTPWTLAAIGTALIAGGDAVGATGFEGIGGWLTLAGLAAIPFALVEGVRLLRRGYRLAEVEARRRTLWMVTGLSSGTGLLVVSLLVAPLLGIALLPLLPDFFDVTIMVSIVLIPFAPIFVIAGIATGMFYSGAIDPGLVIRRTTMYGALGILGTFAFAGVEQLVTSYLVSRFRLPESTGPIVAGGVVAVLISPLYTRLRRWLGIRGDDENGECHESLRPD